MKTEFEQILQALKTAGAALDSTIPVCQSLADKGKGCVCTGCPAMLGPKRCAVQELRDRIKDLLMEAK